jgi:hypothetical protein
MPPEGVGTAAALSIPWTTSTDLVQAIPPELVGAVAAGSVPLDRETLVGPSAGDSEVA